MGIKNTKIAALKFLVNHYDGFNEKTFRHNRKNYAELSEDYISKYFQIIYIKFSGRCISIIFNNTSVIVSKKLELILIFSKKTDVIQKLMSFYLKELKMKMLFLRKFNKVWFYENYYQMKIQLILYHQIHIIIFNTKNANNNKAR